LVPKTALQRQPDESFTQGERVELAALVHRVEIEIWI
jgi:hypothetical protein